MRYWNLRVVAILATLCAMLAPSFAVAAQEATPEGSPVVPGAFNEDVVAGNGLHLLEPAPEGEVAIIAMGPMVFGQVAIIVHNNTDQDVGFVQIDAAVFGEDRELLDVSQNGVSPGRLLPGGIGFTTLGFDEEYTAGMVEIETLVRVDEPDPGSIFDSLMPSIGGWERQGDQMVTMLVNTQDELIVDPAVRAACFDADGTLVEVMWMPTDDEEIPVGGQIRSLESVNDERCPYVVITSDGEQD